MNVTVLFFDTLDSTNTEALRQARAGAGEGVCVVAAQQTAGRGRHGRTWISPKGAGLYFSIILRPKLEPRLLPLITLMTGVAVHQTLSDIGLAPDIKWVNDVHVNEKKICGILSETTETETGTAVVVGIGINLRSDNFPPELVETATSIRAEIEWNDELPTLVQERLIKHLSFFYHCLLERPASVIEEWRNRSTYFSGKRVRVTTSGETIVGVTDGLEESGALRVRLPDGVVSIIHSGDVERLRATTD